MPLCAHARAHTCTCTCTHTPPKTWNTRMHTELSASYFSFTSPPFLPLALGVPNLSAFPARGVTLPDQLSRWWCPFLTFLDFFPSNKMSPPGVPVSCCSLLTSLSLSSSELVLLTCSRAFDSADHHHLPEQSRGQRK